MALLRLALTVQLLLYVVAIVAAVFSVVRFARLQKLASIQRGNTDWWQSPQARAATSHAVRPLWLAAIAVLCGAIAPRLLGALHG